MNTKEIQIADLLTNPQALDNYLADIQNRREQRRRITYWTESVDRLQAELQVAVLEDDPDTVSELQSVIAAFQSALTEAGVCPVDHSAPAEVDAPAVDTVPTSESVLDQRPPPPGMVEILAADVQPLDLKLVEFTPPIDEERRRELSGLTADLIPRITAHLAQPTHDLPHEMGSRSLFCETEAILADYSISRDDQVSLQRFNSDLAMSCYSGQIDFPYEFRSTTPEVWRTLAAGYERCIIATEALAWYSANLDYIDRPDRTQFLSSIAAVQKSLFRLQEYHGGMDRCQNEFFKRIIELKDSAGWLPGLDPNTSDEELEEIAGACESVFTDIRALVDENVKRAGRQARMDAAVQAVVDWEESLEGRSITTATIETDRAALSALLDTCLQVGVPPSNVKVRAAILDTASVLLIDQPKFARFLKAVLEERKRKKLDDIEVEEAVEENASDDDFETTRLKVAKFTRGKKVVVYGGKTRPKVREELSRLLECDLTWPDSEPTDKSSKFDTLIKKSDVVLLNKNFIRHEMFYRAKDLMSETGGHFIVLPSGYGVKQVVSQIAGYLDRDERRV